MQLRRGFTVTPGETTAVVEDVITTGGTTRDVVEVLRAAGANVVAAGSIIDRSGGQADVSVPRVALVTMHVAAHYPDACPMCRQGVPVVKPGSRPA
jgi:orotate phosphoribosyltransferase